MKDISCTGIDGAVNWALLAEQLYPSRTAAEMLPALYVV